MLRRVLLLLMVAACVVVTTTRSTAMAEPSSSSSSAGSAAGFDVLSGLLAKIQSNLETTHKMTEAKFHKDVASCNATMEPLKAEVEERGLKLAAAHWKLDNATVAGEQLAAQFDPLNKRLAAAQLEMDRMAHRVKSGDADRLEEAHLVKVKVVDTDQIVEVVAGLAARLAQVNVTQFSFRAVLESARAQVQDRALGGLLDNAAAAAAAHERKAPKEVVHASDEATVVRLRTLLGLLTTELEQYRDTLVAHDAEAAADWKTHRAHLEQRVDELFQEIKGITESKAHLRERLDDEKRKAAEARATIGGPIATALETWKARLALVQSHCDLKRKHFEAEEQARESQGATLSALTKLTFQHADSGYDLGIGGIPVPHPTTCCQVCSGDRPAACGDKCVPASEFSVNTCGVGCACAKGDVRLAITKQ